MDKDTFRRAAGLDAALADRWYAHVIQAMDEADVNTPERQACFIAQIGHESTGFTQTLESLNYSVAGLQTFGKRLTAAQRQELGRKPGQPPLTRVQQERIANIVYANRIGNGPPSSGDGWRYRGRGLKQVTGRANYSDCGKYLNLPLVDDPALLLQDEYAARSAAWFWRANRCNAFADKGDFTGLTKRINGGKTGLEDRQKRLQRASKILCPHYKTY